MGGKEQEIKKRKAVAKSCQTLDGWVNKKYREDRNECLPPDLEEQYANQKKDENPDHGCPEAKYKLLAIQTNTIFYFYFFLFIGNIENFEGSFDNTITDPGKIALAIYGGLFAYGGWNYLNYVTEELKDPEKNLPRAIILSVPVVIIIYVLANIAYFTAMSPEELLLSNAVAVTFGDKLLGPMAWIMPISVALSTFGGVNGLLLTGSRIYFVGARQGHLPDAIAMISVKYKTPTPSLVLTCFLSLMYLLSPNIITLINYFSFVTWTATGTSIAALLYLRWKEPNMPRPVEVNLLLPISFLLACVFLVIMGIYAAPMDTLIGIIITLSGVPVYLLFVYYIDKLPTFWRDFVYKCTLVAQKLFVVVKEEKED
ncbi:large neutral amino acids transporter small subunit 2-like [Anneissia japonica]|uniref:large neutral amino acids transporter small subunit 2-like n=1 Tax=Anneissia japonica TaxID=1529436 RepID=UPI001425B4EA|nr:large neutral amino acids transporter small subunit 2-like [Anneissia japonica]